MVLSMKLNLNSFSEIVDFFNDKGWDLNENFMLNTSFVFYSPKNVKYPNKLIQNIPPFWACRCP
jgi:hypothetical protein